MATAFRYETGLLDRVAGRGAAAGLASEGTRRRLFDRGGRRRQDLHARRTRAASNNMVCLSVEDGAVLWTTPIGGGGGPNSTPTVGWRLGVWRQPGRRPGLLQDRGRRAGLGQELREGLRRQDDVGLGLQRVGAGRWRPRDLHARRRSGAAGGPRQEDGRRDLEDGTLARAASAAGAKTERATPRS